MGGIDLRGIARRFLIATGCVAIAGCAASRPTPAPPPSASPARPETSILGVASWYGPGFDGHRTSSGEIYDQEDLTAASEAFALGSVVMVTNLENGHSVEVTINDHGPYVKGRKIDLSRKAARMIGMLQPGTAKVRIDVVSAPAGSRPPGSPPRYFVQVGSFSRADNADKLRDQLGALYPDVRVQRLEAGDRRYYRVRMGAFSSRADAQARAASSARFGLPIVIVSE